MQSLARVMQWHELTVYNNRIPGGLTLGFAMHLVCSFLHGHLSVVARLHFLQQDVQWPWLAQKQFMVGQIRVHWVCLYVVTLGVCNWHDLVSICVWYLSFHCWCICCCCLGNSHSCVFSSRWSEIIWLSSRCKTVSFVFRFHFVFYMHIYLFRDSCVLLMCIYVCSVFITMFVDYMVHLLNLIVYLVFYFLTWCSCSACCGFLFFRSAYTIAWGPD